MPEISPADIKDILEIDQFLQDGTMFHDTESRLNCENFQDLGPCCSPSASANCFLTDNTKMTEDINNWIASTPVDSPLEQSSFFSTTPRDTVSPACNILATDMFYPEDKEMDLDAELFDIANIPVILSQDNATYEEATYGNSKNLNDAITNENDSLMEFVTLSQNLISSNQINSCTPVDDKETVISEYIISEADKQIKIESDILLPYKTNQNIRHKNKPLRLNFKSLAEVTDNVEPTIATPDVLNYVEELEAEKFGHLNLPPIFEPIVESPLPSTSWEPTRDSEILQKPKEELIDSDEDRDLYAPPSKRGRRLSSQDSDETYTPHRATNTNRKYRKRVSLPTQVKEPRIARRGRPPKRRESLASVSTVDDDASYLSTEDMRYRELRDKNNEASKKSRLHRKMKEREMGVLAEQLEERNKILRVRANVLEQLSKKMKAALFNAMLGK